MKSIAALAIVAIAAIGATYMLTATPEVDVETQFQDFVSTYRKSYATSHEYTQRLGIFADNLKEIAAQQAANPAAEYGVNHLADLSKEERLAMLRWQPSTAAKHYINTVGAPTKDDVNWVELDDVTKVKDQGSCGSCWAFAGVETIESAYAIVHDVHGDKIPVFAEQQVVDCARWPEYGSMGCQGGWMEDAFEYASKHPLCLEKEYPYTARDGTCQDSKCSFESGVTGYVNIPEGDMDALLEATEVTPVSIAVDATSWSFYRGGIHKSKGKQLNHGVELDGFHIHSTDGDYLLVRNSWGMRWGEEGYIKLDTVENSGADLDAVYPTMEGMTLPRPAEIKAMLNGQDRCENGDLADEMKNCLCTDGAPCDRTAANGENGCKPACGCGEFGFCR